MEQNKLEIYANCWTKLLFGHLREDAINNDLFSTILRGFSASGITTNYYNKIHYMVAIKSQQAN